MAYLRNEPIATDDLTVSQPKLATNTNQADDSFGVDHYKFSDTTPNNGFHNTVTQPIIVGSAHPATAVGVTKIYAMQDYANVGLIEYSRGPSSAVPTPITYLHSTAAAIVLGAGGTTNVLDFTGVSFSSATLHSTGTNGVNVAITTAEVICLAGVLTINVSSNSLTGVINIQVAGNILQLKSNVGATDVFWTLVINRIQ